MMTTFAIAGICTGIMALVVWLLFALTLDTWTQRGIAFIVAVVLWFLFTMGLVTEVTTDQKNWNNGYCTECGGEYKFSGVCENRSDKDYYYSCVECDHTIKVETIKK